MNVSMIVLNPFTHDARVLKEARTLVEHGYRVTVNALWEPGLPMQETIQGIQVQRVRLRSREGLHIPLAAWVELTPKFVSAIRRQHPQICHAHDLNALLPAFLASQLSGSHLIYDAHEFETGRTMERSGSTALRRQAWKILEGMLIHRADAVITVSISISNELSRMYRVSPPVVIKNCPELIDLPPCGKLRAEFKLPGGQPVILFQGVLSEGRGLENAVRAMEPIKEACMVMVGDGPLRKPLENLAREHGIQDRLLFTGKVPLQMLLSYTRDASIGLCLTENTCANHFYSLPNKLFEYMMAGVPILTSNFPDMRQVVEETGAGRVTDPADVREITQTIQEMLSDMPRLDRMAVQARQACERKYNWDMEAVKLLDIYEGLRGGR